MKCHRIVEVLRNGLYLTAIVAASPWLVYRAWKTNRYRDGWSQKWFGLVPRLEKTGTSKTGPVFWCHAVSVGEVQLLRTLIEAILTRWPDARIAISTTTQTGMELASKSYAKHHVFYMPLDFTWAVRQAFQRIQPDWLLLAELEIWPNLIAQAKRQGCHVGVINGRLSKKSFYGYQRLRWALQSSFEKIDFVGTQDEAYAKRFVAMGAKPDCVEVTGNLKFDGANVDREHPQIVQRRQELNLTKEDLVWVAGSTQAPEENSILETYIKLRSRYPALKLILVPRHPERGEELTSQISEKIRGTDLQMIRRGALNPSTDKNWDILLAATIGELRWWWGLATIAFVGGSFGSRGGQNMIEPVAYGIPTAVGPNTGNFIDVMRILIAAEAIDSLDSSEDLESWACNLLDSTEKRQSIGDRGIRITRQHRGATDRTIQLLLKVRC